MIVVDIHNQLNSQNEPDDSEVDMEKVQLTMLISMRFVFLSWKLSIPMIFEHSAAGRASSYG
jgi:hypothetical protein